MTKQSTAKLKKSIKREIQNLEILLTKATPQDRFVLKIKIEELRSAFVVVGIDI